MAFFFKVIGKWLGYVVERTLLSVGDIVWDVFSVVLFWAIDVFTFPIRCIKAYDQARAAAYALERKGGHDNGQND